MRAELLTLKGVYSQTIILPLSFPQQNVLTHYSWLFNLKYINKLEDSDLAHFFEETTKVKNFLRLNHLYTCSYSHVAVPNILVQDSSSKVMWNSTEVRQQ